MHRYPVLLLALFIAPLAAAQGLTVSYFANPDLGGDPVVRIAGDVPVHDWGDGAPAADVPVDYFSARWSGTLTTRAGQYRLRIATEGGVRLWCATGLLIDDWSTTGEREIDAVVDLPAGGAPIELEYRHRSGPAHIALSLALDGQPPIAVSPNQLRAKGAWNRADDDAGGLLACFRAGTRVDGVPLLQRIDHAVAFDWGAAAPAAGVPADHFTAVWSGWLTPRFPGAYTLTVDGDDGFRLWIDGRLLIDDWHDGAARTRSAAIDLAASAHAIRLEFYEDLGDAKCVLTWSSADEPARAIDQRFLTPLADAGAPLTAVPRTSFVSPLSISGFAGGSPLVTAHGDSQPATFVDGVFFASDVDLTPRAATPIAITADGVTTTAKTRWVPLRSSTAPALVRLRLGDRVLIARRRDEEVAVDQGCGVMVPAEPDPTVDERLEARRFTEPGWYAITWRGADGGVIRSTTVVVIAPILPSGATASVQLKLLAGAWTQLDGRTDPANAIADLRMVSASPGLDIDVGQADDGATLRLLPQSRGHRTAVVSIADTGAVVALVPSIAYEIERQGADHLSIIGSTDGLGTRLIGRSRLVMRPFVSGVNLSFAMFAHFGLFADGSKTMSITTGDATSSTGEPGFALVPDPASDEPSGVLEYRLTTPYFDALSCYSVSFQQVQ